MHVFSIPTIFLAVIFFLIAGPVCLNAEHAKAPPTRPYREHLVCFAGTPYELNVYRIYGRIPGTTIIILGGIQGNEPGGNLSADLYVDLNLDVGDLIVVPRANFKSIILYQRAPDGDMNRQFHLRHNGSPKPCMSGVVNVVKGLMREADVFLNLHDGRGFHRPTYVDDLHNPSRFGQSIVIDTASYTCKDTGEILPLADVAKQVLADINSRIADSDHHLWLFNTHTDTEQTYMASEMRKTATWYALTRICIPAFGIETSKNLPSTEAKVRYHNYAVNAFMAYYGIVPEYPPVLLLPPKLISSQISINGKNNTLYPGDSLVLWKGDEIRIRHIEANYDRGLSCDVLGLGSINDLGRALIPTKDTTILFRKDEMVFSRLKVTVRPQPRPSLERIWVLTVQLNGKRRILTEGETLWVNSKDILVIEQSFAPEICNTSTIKVNFKGFVPLNGINTGDDRGHPICLDDGLIKRFSVNGKGLCWPVVTSYDGKKVATFYVTQHKS